MGYLLTLGVDIDIQGGLRYRQSSVEEMGLLKLGHATVNLNLGNPRSDAGAVPDRVTSIASQPLRLLPLRSMSDDQ